MSDDGSVILGATVSRSASIASLAAALAKAQSKMEGAAKDKTNPHYKSSYADLASVWEACRKPLSDNGLSIVQPAAANGASVTVTTILMHDSGEWIEGELTMTATQNTPQGIGSCLTYARRYALSSMVGIAPEDDDGNAASQGEQAKKPEPAKAQVPPGFGGWLDDLIAVADEGTAALEAAWKKSPAHLRGHLMDTNKARWESLKAKAATVKAVAHA